MEYFYIIVKNKKSSPYYCLLLYLISSSPNENYIYFWFLKFFITSMLDKINYKIIIKLFYGKKHL